MVGITNGQNIGMKVQNLARSREVTVSEEVTYPLYRGTNKLTMTRKGLVYVMMSHTKTMEDAEQRNLVRFILIQVQWIAILILQKRRTSGTLEQLLGKLRTNIFDGKASMHMTFETNDFRKYVSTNGNELIDLYDMGAHGEIQLLSLEK